MISYISALDLAGNFYHNLNLFEIKKRIDRLIDEYVSLEILRDRLEDLPLQLENPQPRCWQHIDWHNINREQIINIDFDVFISIIVGSLDTEAPIRGYTQTSRQYLEKIHPQMARFVGGIVAEDGTMLELGLWEKEERQHTPALMRVYTQLTGKKITPTLRSVKTYQPTQDSYADLYSHGLHRVITEYSATCLYLWLMASTTGTLQQVFAELLQDEINHMTKFWGFGAWLFPESYPKKLYSTLCRFIILKDFHRISHVKSTTHLVNTFGRMMGVLNWNSWSLNNRIELIYTFILVMFRLWGWNSTLKPEYLKHLLEIHPLKENC